MRGGADGVDNFAGWLTTIVARVCLDMLRGRKSRREVPVDAKVEALPATDNPEREGIGPEVRGRDPVADIFRGRARAAQLALVDGYSGFVFAPGGRPRVIVDFVLENDRIVEISMIAEPERIAALDLKF